MNSHFPKNPTSVCVKHTGSWKEHGKDRKTASVGFIDVGCPDARERVARIIVSKNLKITIGDHDLKVTRARTEAATARNSALRNASDLLTKRSWS